MSIIGHLGRWLGFIAIVIVVMAGFYLLNVFQADRGRIEPKLASSPMESSRPTPAAQENNSDLQVVITQINSRSGYLFEQNTSSTTGPAASSRLPLFQVPYEREIIDTIRADLLGNRPEKPKELSYYNPFVHSITVKGQWAAAGVILVDKVTRQPIGVEPTLILLHQVGGNWEAEFEGTARFQEWLWDSLKILFDDNAQGYWRTKYDIP